MSDTKIKTVGILINEEESIFVESIFVEDLIDKLDILLKNVIILKYRKFDKKEESILYITKKDFSWQGSLKSNNLQNFVKKEFDLLINYSYKPNLHLNMVTLLSKATFKTGFASIDDKLFDLIIDEPNFNIGVFNKELKKYLTILNKL